MTDLWVFGYASLMWNPGFDYVEKRRARLSGYHRSLCIASWEHRGTKQQPGLVMGLDRGGSCIGVAFRIAPENQEEIMAYLHARELITNVYLERTSKLTLEKNCSVNGIIYVADPTHEQYAGRLSVDDAVTRVCGAIGGMGSNVEYVLNTANHIKSMGIKDPWLEEVAQKIRIRQKQDF